MKKEPLYTGEMRIAKDETDNEYLLVGVPTNEDYINNISKIKGLHNWRGFDRLYLHGYKFGAYALKEKPVAGDIFEVNIQRTKKSRMSEEGSGYYVLKPDGTFIKIDEEDVKARFAPLKRDVGKLVIPDETF